MSDYTTNMAELCASLGHAGLASLSWTHDDKRLAVATSPAHSFGHSLVSALHPHHGEHIVVVSWKLGVAHLFIDDPRQGAMPRCAARIRLTPTLLRRIEATRWPVLDRPFRCGARDCPFAG